MMLTTHPAPGVDQLVPGVRATGRSRRPSIGELVPGYFTLPQNPLAKSLAQVQGIPTSVGPSRVAMHGIGDITLPLVGTLTTSDMITYGAVAVGAFMLLGMMGGRRRRSRAGGSSRVTVSSAPAV